MSARVLLSTTIYPRQCLEDAVAAYSAICSVKLTRETHGALEVLIMPIPGPDEQANESRVVHEFLNYLLDVSLEHHLQAA